MTIKKMVIDSELIQAKILQDLSLRAISILLQPFVVRLSTCQHNPSVAAMKDQSIKNFKGLISSISDLDKMQII